MNRCPLLRIRGMCLEAILIVIYVRKWSKKDTPTTFLRLHIFFSFTNSWVIVLLFYNILYDFVIEDVPWDRINNRKKNITKWNKLNVKLNKQAAMCDCHTLFDTKIAFIQDFSFKFQVKEVFSIDPVNWSLWNNSPEIFQIRRNFSGTLQITV